MPFQTFKTVHLNKTSLRTAGALDQSFDWRLQPAIVSGASIASFTVDVLNEDETASTAFSAGSQNISGTETQFQLTDVATKIGSTYIVVVQVTLNDGQVLSPEGVTYIIE